MDYQALLTPNIVKSFPQETDYIYQSAVGAVKEANRVTRKGWLRFRQFSCEGECE